MKGKSKFLVGVIFLLLINIGLPIFDASGKVNLGEIVSKESEAPTIDGHLTDDVWQDATPATFTLYNYLFEVNFKTITIYSLFSNNVLYMGFMLTETYTSAAAIDLVIKSNDDSEIVDGVNPFSWGNYHDLKYVNTYGLAYDYYLQSDTKHRDIDNAGTEDLTGNALYESGAYYFELSTPFSSNDVNGKDFSVTTKGELEIFIIYTTNFGTEYSFYKPTSQDWGSVKLTFDRKELPINLGFIALFALSLTVFISKKRK